MALNQDKVRAKLASFDKTKKGGKLTTEQQLKIDKIKKYIWKPEPGKQVVRIVPNQFQNDFPVIELKWHYDFNGDRVSYLSPSSVNQPDPIVELANRLEKVKESWLKGRKMQPKLRTYVPIIVRGREEEGVKFWGFGARVCEQLMKVMNQPEDYGDITDLTNGCDIQVDFKSADELKADFPETQILVKPKPRPVIDPAHPKAAQIMELITKKQPKIFDIYTPATYEELAAALEIKLERERTGQTAASEPRGAERTAPAKVESVVDDTVNDTVEGDNVVLPTEEQIEASAAPVPVAEVKAPAAEPVSPTAQKAKKVSMEDFEEAFKEVTGFNK